MDDGGIITAGKGKFEIRNAKWSQGQIATNFGARKWPQFSHFEFRASHFPIPVSLDADAPNDKNGTADLKSGLDASPGDDLFQLAPEVVSQFDLNIPQVSVIEPLSDVDTNKDSCLGR